VAEPNERERELARQLDHELVLLSEDAGTLEECAERTVDLIAVKLAEYREEIGLGQDAKAGESERGG
jgi:hypothetical protein